MKSSSKTPLLTILIATRNRVSYAISAIESILAIPDKCFELVIQDNTDTKELGEYLKNNIVDSRLKYYYTPPPFSSMDNFNAALEHATGEYVCMIGDDDGVNPEIITATRWAKSQNLDSLSLKQDIYYLWPSSGVQSTLFTKTTSGLLSISEFSGDVKIVDQNKELERLVANGGLYYLEHSLPKLYHGLVKRECLNKVRARVGQFLGGLSPDIYSAVSLALVTDRVAITDYPLTIPGACNASTSVSEGAVKSHSKRLEDAPHFRARTHYIWNEIIPKVYTVESIWADSALTALKDMGRDDLIKVLNIPKFTAFSMISNNGIDKVLYLHLVAWSKSNQKNIVIASSRLIYYLVIIYFNFFSRRIAKRFLIILGVKKLTKNHNVVNMSDATTSLVNYLNNHNEKFEKYEKNFNKNEFS